MTAELLERAEIVIGGMTCASCVGRIESAIDALEGVANSRVDLTSQRAVVSFDPGKLNLKQLHKAIGEAGYTTAEPQPPQSDTEASKAASQASNLASLNLGAALTAAIAAMTISSFSALHFRGWEWLILAISTPVVLASGSEFHRRGWAALLRQHATMDSLVSLGTLTAWGWSTVIVVGGFEGHLYFDTATVIVAVLLLGRRLEGRAKQRAGEAIAALAELEADTARLPDGRDVPAASLKVGMRFLVRPGERIAADGIVREGHSAVDTSAMTGEPVPVEVGPGGEVMGGTLNESGALVVEARRVGAETTLAHVKRLTDEALSRKAPMQRHADRITAVFVPAVLIAAATTLAVSLAIRAADDAVSATVAVLIAACPCALGLAIPAAFVAGSGKGAQMGVIIRGPDALESARRIDVVALDKTGTITEGRLKAVSVETAEGVTPNELLALAATLESRSEHPAAAAIVAAAKDSSNDEGNGGGRNGSERLELTDFKNLPGRGVRAKVSTLRSGGSESGWVEASVGKPELFDLVPPELAAAAAAHAKAGRTVVLAGRGGTAEGLIALADKIRSSAPAAVAAWHGMGMEIVMLSGDGSEATNRVGREVGVDRSMGGLTPSQKAEEVLRLQDGGKSTAMVGDGINDAPALATADLGVAMGSGADVAQAASDLTLIGEDLRVAVDAMALSRSTLKTIRVNLFWAFAYNTAIIPVAALGLLRPEIAAVAMGLSSLFVLGNSLRLTRFRTITGRSEESKIGGMRSASEAPAAANSVRHSTT